MSPLCEDPGNCPHHDHQPSYAEQQRVRLNRKIRELREAGWDVVARRERDLAWSERDDARDELDLLSTQLTARRLECNALREVLAFYADQGIYVPAGIAPTIWSDNGKRARVALALEEIDGRH